MIKRNLAHKRMDYSKDELLETNTFSDPLQQFDRWYQQAENEISDEVNAMVLSTSALDHSVSSRIVLLKEYGHDGFLFFTNYNSKKGIQLEENPNASLLFFWSQMQRQVRIEGVVKKISEDDSNAYFLSRPHLSQLSAMASPQSQVIPDKNFLENNMNELLKNKKIERPKMWGGYIFIPKMFEFWQGRPSRLHDRISYQQVGDEWVKLRLAP